MFSIRLIYNVHINKQSNEHKKVTEHLSYIYSALFKHKKVTEHSLIKILTNRYEFFKTKQSILS